MNAQPNNSLKRQLWLLVLAAGIAASIGASVWLHHLDAQSVRTEIANRGQIKLQAIHKILRCYFNYSTIMAAMLKNELMVHQYLEKEETQGIERSLLAKHPGELTAIAIKPPEDMGEAQSLSADGSGRLDPPVDSAYQHALVADTMNVRVVRGREHHPLIRLGIAIGGQRDKSGYLLIDWNVIALITQAIAGTPPGGLDIETGAMLNGRFIPLHSHRSKLRKSGEAEKEGVAWRSGFSLNGARFEVRAHAAPALLRQLASSNSVWALFLGVVLSLLLAYLTYNRGCYSERLRQDVAKQTREIEGERQKLSSIVNHANETILLMDDQGGILRANPAASELFGYAPEEWSGISVHALVPEEIREQHIRWFTEEIADHRHGIMGRVRELTARRKDGSLFPCEVTVDEFTTDGGRRLSIILRDLTARKQAEMELVRLKIAVEQVPEGIFIADHEGRIVYANPSSEELANVPSGQLHGVIAAEVRGGKQGDAMYNTIFSSLKRGRPWRGDVEFVRTDGVRRIIERSAAPVMEAGEVRYYVCVDSDVTEQRQSQSRMEHAQRLESLGVLAGGIAHDFNNILTAIMGNAALGRMKLDDANPALAHLARIEESSQRAAELCKQMLAYSGKGQFDVKPVNLSDLVEKITKLLQVSISKNVALKFHLAKNLPAVMADTAQLQQIIMNLVTNASEAIAEKSGVISLSTGMMHTDDAYLRETCSAADAGKGRYVFLEVADTGCGMDALTQKKLFDPFFTTKFTGRGLGMSAVLGIVRGHHGAIKVYSEPGAGTTFKMLLPASKAEPAEQVENSALNDWRGAGVVLIVDDEETIRETAAMMLEEMGFDTLTAEDGKQGVEAYRTHQDKIVAVLLDMTMPKLDGKGCFRELRRINRDVRVILSSGYNEQDATNCFAGQGLSGFIQKPYTPGALRLKMQGVIS